MSMPYFLILSLLLTAFSCNSHKDNDFKIFKDWLIKNEKVFLNSTVKKDEQHFILIDNTKINIKQLKRFLALKPAELIGAIENEKIEIDIFCTKRTGVFEDYCNPKLIRQEFVGLGHLQGQFKPLENKILLKDFALKGSLVHEWIHAQQYKRAEKINGKNYKYERVQIEKRLISEMDEIINIVKDAERSKKKIDVNAYIKQVKELADKMRSFGYWQDLIDERSIFVLFLKYTKEINPSAEDIALARKNLGFICKKFPLKDCELI